MPALDDILRQAKRLKRGELSRLLKQLGEHLVSTANPRQAARQGRVREGRKRYTPSIKRSKPAYARTLALSGMAHSGLIDVSSNKGKYLAEAYALRPKA